MKQFIILSMLLWMPIATMGQSISKQINDIKRSSKYITAEATLETEAKAYELANELLMKQVSEYMAEKGALKDVGTVVVKNVSGRTEMLQMKRGTMTRIFLYVKKKDIIPVGNVRVIVNNKNQQKKEEAPLESSSEIDEVELVDSVGSEYDMISGIDSIAIGEEIFDSAIASSYPTWQQEVIYTLIGSSSIKSALYLIDRFRTELKIKRHGPASNCRNSKECYWIIFNDNEQVMTILGPGDEQRTNFVTFEKDTLNNYSGKSAIWFTLSNSK
ncbi:MAG: hypothetical protein IJ540_11760 [Prevotella sp.]|nr:hypothetical protein [Prevotella sp.]